MKPILKPLFHPILAGFCCSSPLLHAPLNSYDPETIDRLMHYIAVAHRSHDLGPDTGLSFLGPDYGGGGGQYGKNDIR